jgi:hypothetical protein
VFHKITLIGRFVVGRGKRDAKHYRVQAYTFDLPTYAPLTLKVVTTDHVESLSSLGSSGLSRYRKAKLIPFFSGN